MSTTNVHVMGFKPPMKYDAAFHKLILGHQIKKNTNWIIAYGSINYIIGNVWNNLTHNFEPGPGANLVVSGKITQNDINNINNAYKTYGTSNLIFSLGHKYKNDYNNNNWYRSDVENSIAFDRFRIQQSLSHTPIAYNNTNGNMPQSLSNAQTMNGTPTAYNNSTETDVSTKPTTITITPNKRKFKRNILKDLNNEIKANIQFNSTLNNDITNATNISLLSHPDGKKLDVKLGKILTDNKDESILSNPNDKKLIEKSKKKWGNNKTLYSPSSTKETPCSNLTHTETHSNNSNLTHTETRSNKIHTTPHITTLPLNGNNNEKLHDLSTRPIKASQIPMPNDKNNIDETSANQSPHSKSIIYDSIESKSITYKQIRHRSITYYDKTLPNDNKLNGLSSTQETTQLKLIGKHKLKKSLLHSNTIPETPHSDFAHTETNPNNTAHSNLIHLKEHSNIHSNVSPKTPHSASIVSNPNVKTLIEKSDKKLGDLSIISFEASQTPIPNGKNNIDETLSISKSYLKIDLNGKKVGKILGDDKKLCNTLSTTETHPNTIYTETHPNKKTHTNVPHSTHTSSHTNTNGSKQLLNASRTPQIPNTTLIPEKLNAKIYIQINEKIDEKYTTITPKNYAFLRALTNIINAPISTPMTVTIKIC